ncbi:uncharacterized protein LOC128547728 [Mercenaria mercenaria]|uniref:uncharacterized protein LOC128547728 n=1 Tax=Mercenaria mercenaria TaxID=6596 RepID=UPI00234F6A06|nr:uncharacterized protein LOC128547728 [Mercenaria mercenaria]
MCVHLFGASSSPGCANFGLKQVAKDNEDDFGKDVADFLRYNFYVDDGLKSMPSVVDAVRLIERNQAMCKQGGLRLHKFASTSKEVLSHISSQDRANGLTNIDIFNQDLPVERALGVQWCIESDSFQFRIVLSDKPLTRRGILSTVSSIYDPLGFISPITLVGKKILQTMCGENIGWVDPVPDTLGIQWESWRRSLQELHSLHTRRCLKPINFGEPTVV